MDLTAPVSAAQRIDALLSPQEVAALLGVSPRTVRRLANEGVVTRVRIGHRTSRYTRRSVLALIDPPKRVEPGRGARLDQIAEAGDDLDAQR
jgi:excisionase family DNA binding protein